MEEEFSPVHIQFDKVLLLEKQSVKTIFTVQYQVQHSIYNCSVHENWTGGS